MVTTVNSHCARHWETHFIDVKLFNANDTHKHIHSPSHFTDNKSEESSLILEIGNRSLNTSNLPRVPHFRTGLPLTPGWGGGRTQFGFCYLQLCA